MHTLPPGGIGNVASIFQCWPEVIDTIRPHMATCLFITGVSVPSVEIPRKHAVQVLPWRAISATVSERTRMPVLWNGGDVNMYQAAYAWI